jgi:PPK2 family polyphosphate:nucleotide phosphotransferase
MAQPLVVKPGKKIQLADFDPADTGTADKDEATKETEQNIAAIDDLCYRLYADKRQALLIVLQGTDTAGKDGIIRRVLAGIDPVNCRVTAFREPSLEEQSHDFLWRVHKAAPARGDIAIFSRSHYEDVLVARVHKLVPESRWKGRYEQINAFEQLLVDEGTTIVKCFLHISKDEQRRRLRQRLDNPKKRWKFSKADLVDHKLWGEYQAAYDDALTKCNTEHAPWHIVPANHKWYRDLVVSAILRETLERMDPHFPKEEEGLDKFEFE